MLKIKAKKGKSLRKLFEAFLVKVLHQNLHQATSKFETKCTFA
jgi:hypothetical protein